MVLPFYRNFFNFEVLGFCDNEKLDVEGAGEGAGFGNIIWIIDMHFLEKGSTLFTEEFESALSILNFKACNCANNEVKRITNKLAIPFGFDGFGVDFARAENNCVIFFGVR